MGCQESNNSWQNNGKSKDFKKRAEELIELCKICVKVQDCCKYKAAMSIAQLITKDCFLKSTDEEIDKR